MCVDGRLGVGVGGCVLSVVVGIGVDVGGFGCLYCFG